VAEKMSDPIILLNPRLTIIFANSAAIKLFRNTLIGGKLSAILRDARVLGSISRTLEDGRLRTLESSISRPVLRFFEVTMAAISPQEQDIRNNLAGLETLAVVSFHDITTLKRAEKMRTDFVANAGHELKTPLTSLLGFIETLEGPARGDPDALKTFLPIMHAEAERMINIINDLMSLSKIEAEEHVTPEARVLLFNVCRNVKSALDMAAEKRSITLNFQVRDNLPPVRGESEQIFQALRNLVSNAIKYGAEGSEVRITARVVARVGNSKKPGIAIIVTDKGDGIAAKHLPRLTERFYRVDTARSKRIGGTGLGLAIVKHIVTRHLGTLEITSEAGKGTTVTVTLPQA